MKKKIKSLVSRTKSKTSAVIKRDSPDDLAAIPKITTETIANQREEVLRGARKYIYPLQHSKHRIVVISTGIFIGLILAFLTFCVVSLYKLQSTSTFMYRVTQVMPFPVARQGKSFVSYENYLFELRHYMYYYERQQNLSFESESGAQQLQDYKKRALDKVVNDSVVKKLASERGLSISDKELDNQIQLARDQNRLGGSDQVFEDVLREYWGWTINDYRRSLRSEMLMQKVAANIDTEAAAKAKSIAEQAKSGSDFSALAEQNAVSDAVKAAKGDLGFISKSDRTLAAQTVDVLYALQPGQVSEPIVVPYGAGYAYEILKSVEVQGDKVHGIHILIPIKDISLAINDQRAAKPVRLYIKN